MRKSGIQISQHYYWLILSISLLLPLHVTVLTPSRGFAQDISKSETLVLESAEKFFLCLRDKNYKAVWELLSEKSKETIIDDAYNASRRLLPDTQKKDIAAAFSKQGLLFNNYWNAFLHNFDPDMVLEQSRWQMGLVKEDNAEIILKYKTSAQPTILKLFQEDGFWRIGLVETFWARNKVKFFQKILDFITWRE